jgi:hypothetical protein
MKIGDLVTFCPEAWGTPLEDRPLGVVMNVKDYRDKAFQGTVQVIVTAIFPGDDIPYSSDIMDFEVVNENW